jgi:paraquat-inducible protein A
VRFRGIAEVLPGPGIAAFGAVVVLTLWSSMSLDPRLIWDTPDADPA